MVMIKGQHEGLDEALFYIDIAIFKCSNESTLQHFIYQVIQNLMYFSRTCLLVCIHYVMQSISRHGASSTTNTLH